MPLTSTRSAAWHPFLVDVACISYSGHSHFLAGRVGPVVPLPAVLVGWLG
jgi:hypothetical protein